MRSGRACGPRELAAIFAGGLIGAITRGMPYDIPRAIRGSDRGGRPSQTSLARRSSATTSRT